MHGFPIIIDGPNYINRILELNIANRFIAYQLSFRGLLSYVNKKISSIDGVEGRAQTVEFVCSKKRFGPVSAKFTEDQQKRLLERAMQETGVYVDQVDIPGTSEKGVDSTVQTKMEEFANVHDALVLVSNDRDYIPILRKLRHKTRVITVAVTNDFPVEIANESYATVTVDYGVPWLFQYNYAHYELGSFSLEQCAEMYANADDREFNQVRISRTWDVYIARGDEAGDRIDAQCRWETFVPYNKYVGPQAASDPDYIEKEFTRITTAYKEKASGYMGC